jgi:serine protease Do
MTRGALGLALALATGVAALFWALAGGGAPLALLGRDGGRGRTPSFAEIVDRINPAVVNVAVTELTRENPHEGIEDAPELDLPRRGAGSGFVVDPGGYILTNHHVVSGPARIRVRFADKREMPARLVGADPATDVALLKVSAENLPVVNLGDSDRLRVGEWVCAIGNPYSFDHTVTVGVVSSKGRKIFNLSFDSYIQTDAAINPGNSGGPLINAAGEAVGINAAVSSEGQGIGFAVPINIARSILDQLRTSGRVSRGYLGITLEELEPDLQKLIGFKEPKGALVLDVLEGGAGEAAGLKRYDVITAVADQPIDNGDALIRKVAALKPGSPVGLEVLRDGKPLSLTAQLRERGPEQGEEAAKPSEPGPGLGESGDAIGLAVGELPARRRAELGIPASKAGVVVKDVLGLDPGLDELEHGDVVVEVNRKPVPDLASYRRVLSSLRPGEVAWLYVYRPRPQEGSLLVKVEVEAGR